MAISQDLLKSGEVCYGDVLVIPGVGTRIVSDVMNARHRRSVDVWVNTEREEKKFQTKRLEIKVLRSPERECTRLRFMSKGGSNG